MEWPGHVWDNRGTQLLEFALALPFLAVVAIGIMDFGQAYNLKHILTNAAREGARITISNPMTDFSSTCLSASPACNIQATADAVKYYLTNNGLNLASCISPGSPSHSGTTQWIYGCASGDTACSSATDVCLEIDRPLGIAGGPSGTVIPSAQVTLSYPYTFSLGNVIGLLVPGATSLKGKQILTTTVVMPIQ